MCLFVCLLVGWFVPRTSQFGVLCSTTTPPRSVKLCFVQCCYSSIIVHDVQEGIDWASTFSCLEKPVGRDSPFHMQGAHAFFINPHYNPHFNPHSN